MNETLIKFKNFLIAALKDKNPITEEDVYSNIEFINLLFNLSKEELNDIAQSYFSLREIVRDVGQVLTDNMPHTPWFQKSKLSKSSDYWNRYMEYLKYEGFNIDVINSLENDLDQIMDCLVDPSTPYETLRRGLVIGDVQSGKTSTYIGLINKAVDSGYKVIILLTGTIEKLRSQTQERIDLGFLGFDSDCIFPDKKNSGQIYNGDIGVGQYGKPTAPVCLTTRSADFTPRKNNTIGSLNSFAAPVIFVIKKNQTVMNLLYRWLLTQSSDSNNRITSPMLMIDDEADYASINTKKDSDKTTAINECIRNLLGLFYKRTYVGFTATPYANIFINPEDNEDIFPENFLYTLCSPSNYIGALDIYAGVKDEFSWDDDEMEEKGKYDFMRKK